ncbi:hypothetical protein BDF21DRAFT_348014 [Thamnidium elegans]|nr:hypothetical protein BDF21DRAFT_348014 [Thamnidium elegans]
MWWYDAYESYEGFLYLFGKVFDKSLNAYVSCCVIVENIQREIYILPRKYQKLLNINNVRNYHMETCQRKYAFNRSGVPREAEYIKLNYPYTDYRFPQEAMGSTFSNMFGSTVSPLEGFLIQKKIMGPCWLEFNNLKTSQGNSWCLFETRIESPNNCLVVESDKEKLETPPLNTLALSIQTKFNYSTKNTEIITISGFYCKNANINGQDTTTLSPFERFSVTRPISSLSPSSQRTVINPEVDFTITQEISEELMLYTFLAKLQTFDPDIIIGHEFSTIGLSILLRRMKSLKIKGWSRIGRRRLITWPKSLSESFDMDTTTYQEKLAICGRLVCDTFLASQDLVSCKSYSLQDMALSELGMPRKEITSEMMDTFEEQGIISTELARYVSFDAYLTMSIAVKLKILPLTLQLSNLAGNLWARCMYGARSERNEYLLLHSFYNEGYICPDRPAWKAKFKEPLFIDENLQLDCSRKEKDKTNPASYVGGLVLDPKAGLYDDYVLLLDFNSLYPSIIQEYNVCFTTMKQDSIDSVDYNAQGIPSTPSPDVTEGILPKLVGIFVNRRKQVKNLMKNPHLSTNAMSQYNIEQMALKLTANSMYGCLGSPTSRFYARQLAMYITSKGRNILRSAVDTTEQLGYDVIYGDTDSIMVNTQTNMFTEAKQISEKVKGVVNQKYKLLEIGVDGYFKRTLLLKKKKYAMLSVKEGPDGVELTETVEVKGLDLVRRDWCDLSRTVSENVLTKILFDKKSFDIHEYLRNISEKIYNAEYSVDDFIIRKQLNKPLEEYNNEKTLDHVSVAKDMRRARKPVKAGDVIAYIMCKSDVPSDGNTKACIPEEVKNGNAKINIEWYICKQILPPILRLCVVIDDINMDTISRCFGKIILSFRLIEYINPF